MERLVHTYFEVMDMLSEKTKRLCCLFLLALLLCTLFLPRRVRAAACENEDILRLHVIANSDSDEDQAVKLLVRDAVLDSLSGLESRSAEETERYLLSNGKALLSTVEETLEDNGFSYSAQLMLGTYPFPDRTYGDTFYPAGDYPALRILLGRGQGHNWWCVLFPPLCLVSAEDLPEEAAGDITFFSSILAFFRQWRETK